LARTSVGQKYKAQRTASRSFISAEFVRTVEFGFHGPDDDFMVSGFPSTFHRARRC
jgi:hypothetical protein